MSEITTESNIDKAEVKSPIEVQKTESILKKLEPRQVESEDGTFYTIYTFQIKDRKPVEVLFYSPNELPFVETEVQGKAVVINGNDPKWRTNEEWEEFSQKTLEVSGNSNLEKRNYTDQVREAVASGKSIIFVESNPESLLETAEQLGYKLSKPLREALSEQNKQQFSESSLSVVDKVLAGNLVSDEGFVKQDHGHEGDALFLLSLSGDIRAEQSLVEKVGVMQEWDESRAREGKAKFKEQQQDDEAVGQEALKLGELVAVHATSYLPQRNKEGRFEISTTFEGSDGQVLRNTIHFALNHLVAAHMSGTWEGVPYVVIAPLDDTLKMNGKPTNLNTVDTFWEVGLEKKLVLPSNTTVVGPGKLPKGQVISGLNTEDVRYKTDNIQPTDVAMFCDELSEESKNGFNSSLVATLVECFREIPIIDEIVLSRKLMDKLIEIAGVYENRLNILDDLQQLSVEEVVRNVLVRAKIDILDRQIDIVTQKIRDKIISKFKRDAVEKKVVQMGYEVKPGGMWAWGGSMEVTRQTAALGAKLEVPTMPHHATNGGELEEISQAVKYALINLEKIPDCKERVEILNKTKRSIRQTYCSSISQEMRRILYLSGLI
jgi:hypothetical protein